ncbi:MAG TPA: sulfite reductase, ferredoxin dependent, partial [Allocoleopsis sp.]
QNGRIKDEGNFRLKSALREIVETFSLPLIVTPSQDVILYDIDPANQEAIQSILEGAGIRKETEIDPLVRYSMACPALPTCGLAITESERAIPGILDRIRTLLNQVGLPDEYFVIRMTGCPNGCARPYLAELGLVGQRPGAYQLWLGASPNQTRLSEPFLDSVADADLEKILEPIFVCFKQQRLEDESFGDFCHRVGFAALQDFIATYKTLTVGNKTTRHRIGVRDDVYDRLKAAAMAQGKSMSEIVNTAIDFYLQSQAES